MYEINNTTFRNLEEQVQKNKEDIARHYEIDRALANLGITIVGQVNDASLLPDPLTYTGAYGDGYAVGSKTLVDQGRATYLYYIFTRPDPNAGQPNNHWLNVGKISIVGPQGPVGPTGPQGMQGESSQWYSGPREPDQGLANDMWLNTTNGSVYQFTGLDWILQTSIVGPQGLQGPRGPQGEPGTPGEPGPQGERGDVGGFINIRGILTNTDQLPLPSTLDNLTVAYLIGASEPYDLYIQVGENSDVATWNNTGPFNAATLVTVGGEAQNVWDADTKVTKPNTPGSTCVLLHNTNGTVTNMELGQSISQAVAGRPAAYVVTSTGSNNAIPNGVLLVGTPQYNGHAANKKYVDDGLAKKIDVPAETPRGYQTVVGYRSNSTIPYLWAVGAYATPGAAGSIAKYNGNGALMSVEPTADTEVATKKYVDDAVANAGGGGGGGSGLTAYNHVYTFSDVNGLPYKVKFTALTNQSLIDLTLNEVFVGMNTQMQGIITHPVIEYEGSWYSFNVGGGSIFATYYTTTQANINLDSLVPDINPA